MPGNQVVLFNAPGPQGPAGPKGPKGDVGPAGPAGSALSVSGTGFVHWSGTGADATARAVNLASNGANGDVTGVLAVVNLAGGTNGQILQTSGTAATWAALAASNMTPGSAGSVFITNNSGTAAWTALLSVDSTSGVVTTNRQTGAGVYGGLTVQYGGTATAAMGIYNSASGNAALWLGVSALGSTNFLVYTNGTDTQWNTIGGSGIHYFYEADVTLLGRFTGTTLFLDAMATISWGVSTASPTISQVIAASDTATHDILVTPQAPFSSATGTNKHPGNFVIKTALPITADSFFGGLVWQRGDGTPGWRVGYYGGPDLTYTGMWFEDAGAPTGANYAFLGTATRTDLNAASNLNLCIASAYQLVIAGTTSMSMSANANINTFTFGIALRAADVLPGAFTLQGGYAYASATGANRVSGKLVLDVGPPTNSGTTETTIEFSRNAVSFLSVLVHATTPTLQSSSAVTSFTIGTNKSGATLALQGDTASTILTLTTVAEFATSVIYDPVAAPSAPSGNKVTLYSDASDGSLYGIDSSGNIYSLVA